MFRNRLYYCFKPFVPFSVRMGVRRWFTKRKRERVSNCWPILPGSERQPQGWRGWPEGKQFALVLTHDVEGAEGIAKCRRLMELEMKLGFRSSFNFVPENGATVPEDLRQELVKNGFEVGVHDLHHDGKLYRSRQAFRNSAARINEYLREWGAVGFRSGFMLHNLEWAHDLNILYEASTFDTDPFEPQPDGVGTIFPFWVSKQKGGNVGGGANPAQVAAEAGYLELPYTLPQDSTLFLLLRERHPHIWLEKAAWIAKHGGMVLLNVHPDYMDFEGCELTSRTYPALLYEMFLKHVRERFAGSYWHPLPRELAAAVQGQRPQLAPRPLRVCMATYSSYKTDARVSRYANTLAARGDHVDVLALSSSPEDKCQEVMSGVNVFHIQSRFTKSEKSPVGFLLPVLRFLFRTAAWMVREHRRNKYDVLHIHNVPDFLVFAGTWPKLTGASIILDIHDIVPEFYGSKFGVSERSVVFKVLVWMERVSSWMADHVILSNDLWLEKYIERTGARQKCSVFINNVDSVVFAPRPRTRKDGKKIVLFPGGLQWHQGLDIAIQAFEAVSRVLPEAEFHIYGDGGMKGQLIALSSELGLSQKVQFFSPLPVRQIADVMSNADLGVVPKRADSFGNEAYSTKIMEFMSVGVPVIVSKTRIDQHYFNDRVVRFFDSGDIAGLSRLMIELLGNESLRSELVANAAIYAKRHSWESRRRDYLELVDRLCGRERAETVGSTELGATMADVTARKVAARELVGL